MCFVGPVYPFSIFSCERVQMYILASRWRVNCRDAWLDERYALWCYKCELLSCCSCCSHCSTETCCSGCRRRRGVWWEHWRMMQSCSRKRHPTARTLRSLRAWAVLFIHRWTPWNASTNMIKYSLSTLTVINHRLCGTPFHQYGTSHTTLGAKLYLLSIQNSRPPRYIFGVEIS